MVSTSGSCAVRSIRIWLPLLDDREAFARLEAEFLLAFAHHVFDQDRASPPMTSEAMAELTPAMIALRRMLSPVAERR